MVYCVCDGGVVEGGERRCGKWCEEGYGGGVNGVSE